MATHVDILNAMVSLLNAADLSQEFIATKEYMADWDPAELATLRVFVAPTADSTEADTRSTDLDTYTVDIGIAKNVGVTSGVPTVATVEAMLTLKEEIRDLIWSNRRLTASGKSCWLRETDTPVTYDPERLRVDTVFFSVLRCTWEVRV